MSEPSLCIPGGHGKPQVDVHVNLIYALYHYLVRQGSEQLSERDAAMSAEAERVAQVRFPLGVHGMWTQWEVPLASAATLGEAISGLRSQVTHTVDTLAIALREAEPEFTEQVWPRGQPAIETALRTLQEVLAPYFSGMVRQQVQVLGLIWPERIDAYLVADCYDRHSAYSHPLTIDVTKNVGLTLCEAFLHEATHVADVYTAERGTGA